MSLEFITTNAAVAVGIGADAVIATVVRFRHFKDLSFSIKWSCAIGTTHWLFPMIGFAGGWWLASDAMHRAMIYGVGALIMAGFVFSVALSAAKFQNPVHNEENLKTARGFWVAVWAVSIDALITGPGKTVVTRHWSNSEILWSFAIVGLIVFLLVSLASNFARRLYNHFLRSEKLDVARIKVTLVTATWLELAIFTWFGSLAGIEAANALGATIPSHLSWVFCIFWIAALGLVYGQRIHTAQTLVAEHMHSPRFSSKGSQE